MTTEGQVVTALRTALRYEPSLHTVVPFGSGLGGLKGRTAILTSRSLLPLRDQSLRGSPRKSWRPPVARVDFVDWDGLVNPSNWPLGFCGPVYLCATAPASGVRCVLKGATSFVEGAVARRPGQRWSLGSWGDRPGHCLESGPRVARCRVGRSR